MLNANQSTYFVIRHPLLLCTDEASHTQTFHPILQQIYVMISVRTAEGEFTGGSFSLASARQVGVGLQSWKGARSTRRLSAFGYPSPQPQDSIHTPPICQVSSSVVKHATRLRCKAYSFPKAGKFSRHCNLGLQV
jgi:hypothetical protein